MGGGEVVTDAATAVSADIVAAGPTEEAGLEMAREMRRRWRRGDRVCAEQLLALEPALAARPEAAVELVYEEYCLRQAAGEEGAEQDLLRRFPQWARPLRIMLDCHHRLLESGGERPCFPEVGQVLSEFRLIEELFCGPRGRVFVAEQPALAARRVVLKVTALDGVEHLSLARLQHTHIVPLHSVTDDAARHIRLLCMPYFGRATLASVLEALAPIRSARRTGRHMIEAIDRLNARGRSGSAVDGPARDLLERSSYVQAVCWLAACVAEALAFAHERGLVHLDLKPANVLLSSDAQPMLLDFHLARGPLAAGASPPDHFGGTEAYMAPEQRAVMCSLREGRPVEQDVERHADLYALGAILFESLGGTVPVAPDAPPLWRVNPRVSVGLSDIVGRCLAQRAADRYAGAAAVAEDLKRHLADLPLAGVPNRSVAERWRKWRHRRPGALRAASAATLVAAAGAALVAGAQLNHHQSVRQAELALADGERQLTERHFADAVQSFQRGLALSEPLSSGRDLRNRITIGLASARRLDLGRQLHDVADEVRSLYGAVSGAGEASADRLAKLDADCRTLWARRNEVIAALDPSADPTTSQDLRDVAIFASGVRVRLPASSDEEAAHREALRMLDEVQDAFGSSAVIELERAAHRRALGIGGGSVPPPPRTAWEHFALGRALLASDDLTGASNELAAALRLDPGGRWTNFYHGQCCYRAGRYEDAVTSFSVCIGTEPTSAACFYNRALAYVAVGQRAKALADCDRALCLDPGFGAPRDLRAKLVE